MSARFSKRTGRRVIGYVGRLRSGSYIAGAPTANVDAFPYAGLPALAWQFPSPEAVSEWVKARMSSDAKPRPIVVRDCKCNVEIPGGTLAGVGLACVACKTWATRNPSHPVAGEIRGSK